MNNIQVVDEIVRKAEALLSDFFGDTETAYIFTADHGMSEIGNHGDGSSYCTRRQLLLVPLMPPAQTQIIPVHP